MTSYDDAAPLVAAPRRAHHRLMQTQSSAVETSRKERLVLVRVPAFVAEHWKVASEGDAPLGVVQPQGEPEVNSAGVATGRQKYSVRLDKHAEYPASYPHEFELTCAAPAEPLYAFSRPTGKSGARTRLEGRVALRGDVKPAPHLKNEYKQVVRDREAKHSGGNKRAIGVVDSVQTEAHVQLQAKGARVDKEAKREARMDRGPKVTLGPKAEAVGAEVGMEMLGTAPQVEADGREIFLRAGGQTFMESRVLGTPMLELLPMQRLG